MNLNDPILRARGAERKRRGDSASVAGVHGCARVRERCRRRKRSWRWPELQRPPALLTRSVDTIPGAVDADPALAIEEVQASPDNAPVVQTCRDQGREIISEIEYASRVHQALGHTEPVVAVTGANGKTTTTSMIDYMLRHEGWDTACVGNIGTSWARSLSERLTRDEGAPQGP